jgi:hypothetical protein
LIRKSEINAMLMREQGSIERSGAGCVLRSTVVRDEPPQLRIERVIDRDAAALDEISSGQW